jgi:hypothetical protein
MAANRANILLEAKNVIATISEFKKVYTAQTQLSKEHIFPICWVLLGDEDFTAATLQSDYRHLTLIFRIAVKQGLGTDELNPMIDKVIETVFSNYTLNGSIIKLDIERVETDEGLLYPYAVADIVCSCMVR